MSEFKEQLASRSDLVSLAFAQPMFSTARGAGAPAMIVRGEDLRVAWANRAVAALFDVPDYNGLQGRLGGTANPAARALASLVRSLEANAAPRLIRLRLAQGSRIRSLTALCGLSEQGGGAPMLALAFLDHDADGAGSAWLDEAQGEPRARLGLDAPATAAPDLGAPIEAHRQSGSSTQEEQKLECARDSLRAALHGGDVYRFVWRTDPRGVLVQVEQALVDSLRIPLGLDDPAPFAEQVGRFDPLGAQRLAAALADVTTWGGIKVQCPVLDGEAVLPLGLAASPHFDAARNFLGFRGFCRIDLAQLRQRDMPRPLPVEGASPPLEGPAAPTDGAAPLEPVVTALVDAVSGPGPDLSLSAAPDMIPEAAPANPSTAEPDRSANVVQLWPVHPAPLARPAYLTLKSSSLEAADAGAKAAFGQDAGMADGDLRSRIETAVGQSLDSAVALSSTEHQAFEEIGRTLGSVPRWSFAPHHQEPQTVSATSGGRPQEGDTDLPRHAASLVEHMAAGLLVIRNKRVLFANDAVRENLQFDRHSELLDALALHFARLSPATLQQPEATLPLPSAYGEEVAFQGSSRPIPWNGQPATLWTLSTWGTPANLSTDTAAPWPAHPAVGVAAHAVGDASQGLASLLDVAGEAIALTDLSGRVLRLNRQAERYFGRGRAAVEGEDFTSLLAAESGVAAAALLNQVKADANPRAVARGECVARSADGSSLPLEMRIERIDASQVAIVWRDISAQRGLERELAQARRQAARLGDQPTDFLANVSYQVRTPLNAILGFVEIMMDERFGTVGNPRYKDYLRDIHLSGTQVIALVDDLMNLSRIEAGQLDLRLAAVDMNKVIVDCVADAQTLAHRERVIVRTSFGARLPPALVDERSARQIIGNLLSNAIKFNEPGGQVIVSSASPDQASVVIRIRDTGIGMSDSDIASALEPFKQLAPTKNASGVGLGLPLTKALIGANGASLSMRSRPKEGTMAEVTFQAIVPTLTRVPA